MTLKKKSIHLGIDWEDFSLICYEKGLIENYKIFSKEFIAETNYLLDFLKKQSIKSIFFFMRKVTKVSSCISNEFS